MVVMGRNPAFRILQGLRRRRVPDPSCVTDEAHLKALLDFLEAPAVRKGKRVHLHGQRLLHWLQVATNTLYKQSMSTLSETH